MNLLRFRKLLAQKKYWVIVLIAVLTISMGARFNIKMGLSGDEPHYLVMANSLKVDHDLNVKNDYGQKRYLPYYPDTLEPHINWALVQQSGERWHSIHGPGLPLLILPGVVFSKRLGALLIMIGFGLLAVVAGISISKLVASKGASFLAGLMLALSVPFLALAGYIFPDIVIGSLTALTFLLINMKSKTLWRDVAIGVLSATLIWVHVKTSLVAGSLILIAVWYIIESSKDLTNRNRRLAALLVPFILLTGLLQFKFYQWFGVFTPNGIYKGNNQLFQLNPFKSLLAILFDPFKGLLIMSPIWFCAVVGLPEWYKRNKKQLLFVLAIVLPSFFIQSTFDDWAGGWSPPARYTVQYLPILLPALALGLELMLSNAKMRIYAFTLIVAQVTIAATYILFRTPWDFAGHEAPFIVDLKDSLHLNWLPTIFFDNHANPTKAGIVVILSSFFVMTALLIFKKFSQSRNSRKIS